MNLLEIFIIVFTVLMILFITLVYTKYWKLFKPLVKSVSNNVKGTISKLSLVTFIFFSLFFGVLFSTTFTSNQAATNLDVSIGYMADSGKWSNGKNYASNIYVNDYYDDSTSTWDSTLTDYNSDGVIDEYDALDRRNTTFTTFQQEILDSDTNSYDPNILPEFNSSETSDFYKIPGNEYLYLIDYSIAKVWDEKHDFDFFGTDYTFYYSFSAMANFSSFYVDGIMTSPSSKIQVVSIPESNSHNTRDGVLIDSVVPDDGEYKELNKGEAYAINFSHETYSVDSDTNIRIASPIGNDYYDIDVVGTGYHQNYLYPYDQMSSVEAIAKDEASWSGTDNMVIFVSEDTLYDIIETFYYDFVDGWYEGVFNTYTPSYIMNSPRVIEYRFSFWFELGNFDNVFGSETPTFTGMYNSDNSATYNLCYEINRNDAGDVISTTNTSDFDTCIATIELENEMIENGTLDPDQITFYIDTSTDNTYTESQYIDAITREFMSYISLNYRGSSSGEPAIGLPSGNQYAPSTLNVYDNYYGTVDNYNLTKEYINEQYNSSLVFIFIFTILGVVTVIFLISKMFREDSKWMGILKSNGYSQTTISLISTTRIAIYLFVGMLIAIATIPLMLLIWQSFLTKTLAAGIIFTSINFVDILITLLFPMTFILFISFVISRGYFSRKPTLEMINDTSNNKANYLVRSIDKKTSVNTNLFASFSLKNSIRISAQSLGLLVSSISISFFLLTAFTTSTIVDNTSESINNLISFNNLGVYSPQMKSDNSQMTMISESDFISAINEGEKNPDSDEAITDYTFGSTEFSNPDEWVGLRKSDWISKWDSEVVPYINSTPVENVYISNDSYLWIKSAIDNKPPTASSTYSSEVSDMISALNYDSYLKANPNSVGIAIGMNVYDPLTNFNLNLETNSDVTLPDGNVITGDTFTWVNTDFLENGLSLQTSEDQQILDDYIDISTKEDGKIYFLSNSTNPLGVRGNYVKEYGSYDEIPYQIKIPTQYYSSTPSNSEVTVYEFGIATIPFFSFAYINVDDPDFQNLIESPDLIGTNEVVATGISFQTSSEKDNVIFEQTDILNYSNDGIAMDTAFTTRNYLEVDSSTLLSDVFAAENPVLMSTPISSPYLLSSSSKSNDTLGLLATIVGMFGDSAQLEEVLSTIENLISENSASGVGINMQALLYQLALPTATVYQNILMPFTYMAIILSVILMIFVINDIVKFNKTSTNNLKIMGHNSLKITLASYSLYVLIFVLAWAISIPLIYSVGSVITSTAGLIGNMLTIVIVPTMIQITYTLLIMLASYFILLGIGWFRTANLKPALREN